MSQPWYDYPITQAHGVNGEQGVDFGVPFHTSLTAPLPGKVSRIVTDVGWRDEVDIQGQYQGQPVTWAFLHVDRPEVSVGDQVSIGQEIGLSGGQTSGGESPDDPQFSTGPHTEFDIFRGGPWENPMDPTAFLASIRADPQAAAAAAGGGNAVLLASHSGSDNSLPGLTDLWNSIVGALGGKLATGATSDVKLLAWRVGFIGLGIVLVYAGVTLTFGGGAVSLVNRLQGGQG